MGVHSSKQEGSKVTSHAKHVRKSTSMANSLKYFTVYVQIAHNENNMRPDICIFSLNCLPLFYPTYLFGLAINIASKHTTSDKTF